MEYEKIVTLKNGKELLIKHGEEENGAEMFDVFIKTHIETDYNVTYEDEVDFNADDEAIFLKKKKEAINSIQLCGFLDGKMVGIAGFDPIGGRYKIKHRAEYGIGVLEEYWGLGIGKELTKASIECAKKAGFTQLELETVVGNDRALKLYEHLGFKEFGRHPRAFKSKYVGYQDLVLMYMNLDEN